jgi:hypothetical protein
MTITNYNNQYVKVESQYLQAVLDSPSNYSKLQIIANVNNGESVTQDILIPNASTWYVDLNTAVKLGNLVRELFIQNLVSAKKFNTITSPIDLAYVDANCTGEGCTLQDFSTHFAPLFKTQIDAYFASIGITTNVTITFSGNVIGITAIPNYFIVHSITYGVAAPYLESLAGFSDPASNAFLSSDAMYITPEFFSATSTEFTDGIYKLTIKYIYSNGSGFISEANCSFIDVLTKCKVATALNLLKNEAQSNTEQAGTLIHLIHYGLINASNCGCNCDDLNSLYTELSKQLSEVTPNTNCEC